MCKQDVESLDSCGYISNEYAEAGYVRKEHCRTV